MTTTTVRRGRMTETTTTTAVTDHDSCFVAVTSNARFYDGEPTATHSESVMRDAYFAARFV